MPTEAIDQVTRSFKACAWPVCLKLSYRWTHEDHVHQLNLHSGIDEAQSIKQSRTQTPVRTASSSSFRKHKDMGKWARQKASHRCVETRLPKKPGHWHVQTGLQQSLNCHNAGAVPKWLLWWQSVRDRAERRGPFQQVRLQENIVGTDADKTSSWGDSVLAAEAKRQEGQATTHVSRPDHHC